MTLEGHLIITATVHKKSFEKVERKQRLAEAKFYS